MVDEKALQKELLDSFSSIKKEISVRSHGVKISKSDYVKWYLPLVVSYVNGRASKGISTYVAGISGGVGTGKSILSVIVQVSLEALGFSVLAFSIDDYYKEPTARDHLAAKYPDNPFYQQRGLFGTHKVKELRYVLEELLEGKEATILHFDKGLLGGKGDVDRRYSVDARVDFVLFDGWCVGIPSMSSDEFMHAVQSTAYGRKIWKQLNVDLADVLLPLHELDSYQIIWNHCDTITLLLGKNISWHEKWRQEQEHRLIAATGKGKTDAQVRKFVLPFMPFIAQLYYLQKIGEVQELFDCVMTLGKNHIPVKVTYVTHEL